MTILDELQRLLGSDYSRPCLCPPRRAHSADVCVKAEEQKEGEYMETIPHCWLFVRVLRGLSESAGRRYNSWCQRSASLVRDTDRPVLSAPFTPPAKTMKSFTLEAVRRTSAHRGVLCRLRTLPFPEVVGKR